MAQKFHIDAGNNLLGSYDGPDAGNPYAGSSFTLVAPSDGRHTWDNASQTWKPKLSDARKDKLNEVKTRYNAELNGGMTYLAKPLQLDNQSQQDIIAATDSAREAKAEGSNNDWNPAFAWRMGDDSFLTLSTPEDMIALCQVMKAEVYRLKQNRWVHTDAIKALTTVEDIEAYDITTGW